MRISFCRWLMPVALFAIACADIGSMGLAPQESSSIAGAGTPSVVAASANRPTAAAEAHVQKRHASKLIGARVKRDSSGTRSGGRWIVRGGQVIGSLGGPGRATTRDGDEDGCWYLIIYYLDDGEIISVTLLGCTGGGGGSGSQCTADQQAIAAEYDSAGDGTWSCSTFDDAVTHGDGTHGHQKGYLSSSYTSGRSAVWSYMASNHGVTGWINSDWRCPPGNAAVDGTNGSLHKQGRAGDFDANGFNEQMAIWFRDAGIAAGATEKVAYAGHYHLAW